MDLTEASDRELIDELESRGYKADLLFSRTDVEYELQTINKERAEENLPPVVMTDEDKDDVLGHIKFEWLSSRANDDISEAVSEFVEEFDQLNDN